MKRSLLTRYLRLETTGMALLVGLAGVAMIIRDLMRGEGVSAVATVAGILIVLAGAMLVRAVRKV